MLMIGSNEIGGGFVRLAFSDATRRYKVGEALTANQIKSFYNHKSMIKTGHITVYPPAQVVAKATSAAAIQSPRPRHVVSAGFGRFDVFEGRKLNNASLTKEAAEALAAAKN